MDDRHSLTATLRLRGHPVVLVGEGPVAEEQRRLLERAGARIVGEGSKATFAVVVDDLGAVSRMKVRGALVYAVDRPDLCDFIVIETVKPSAARPPRRAARARPAATTRVATKVATGVSTAARAAAARMVRIAAAPPARIARATATLATAMLTRARALLARLRTRSPRAGKTTPGRGRALLLSALGPLPAVAGVISGALQARASRARERPVSLDLALVPGGPLDPIVGERQPGGDAPRDDAQDRTAQPGIARFRQFGARWNPDDVVDEDSGLTGADVKGLVEWLEAAQAGTR